MRPVNFLEENSNKSDLKNLLNNKTLIYIIPLVLILLFIVVDYNRVSKRNENMTNTNISMSDSSNIKDSTPSTMFIYDDEEEESETSENTQFNDNTDRFFNELEKVENNDKIVADMINIIDEYKNSDVIQISEFYFDDYNRTIIIGDSKSPEEINELITRLTSTFNVPIILEDMRPSEYGSYFKLVGELDGTI